MIHFATSRRPLVWLSVCLGRNGGHESDDIFYYVFAVIRRFFVQRGKWRKGKSPDFHVCFTSRMETSR